MTTITREPIATGNDLARVATPLPDRSVVPAVWARYSDLIIERGEGSWLISTDGDRYLDFTAGIGVANTGHAHPAVSAAVAAQAVKLLHGQQNIVYHERGLRLHAKLGELAPARDWGAFLANSGAEAVEAAVKLARVATGRPVVVAFRGGFHGRTAQAMSLTTSRVTVRADFEPLPGSVYHAPYPDPYRGGDTDELRLTWERAMAALFAQLVDPKRVAAFIIEPIVGEGGYIVPPDWFLPRLRELATQHSILLIADEVQTGFGRTGRFWAVEHWDVVPDILVMAKGIASGLQLSGIMAPTAMLAKWAPGAHGGTYGGNVVACAAALATLDVIEQEGLVENAAARGQQLLDGIRGSQAAHPRLGDVRGLGCMVALEFVDPAAADPLTPDAAIVKRVLAAALDRKLILLSAGSFGQVVRIIPPLVTTADEGDLAVSILPESLVAAGA
ncbi:MAG: aminotransferase class III-fold pyridoxal phosphate-dependent enzyme [Chloroflexi bacterium]|nr:aminotransferase class III-fold pyridoxal phosphate-dependent enzyme [Chloroflexota bacterium]